MIEEYKTDAREALETLINEIERDERSSRRGAGKTKEECRQWQEFAATILGDKYVEPNEALDLYNALGKSDSGMLRRRIKDLEAALYPFTQLLFEPSDPYHEHVTSAAELLKLDTLETYNVRQ